MTSERIALIELAALNKLAHRPEAIEATDILFLVSEVKRLTEAATLGYISGWNAVIDNVLQIHREFPDVPLETQLLLFQSSLRQRAERMKEYANSQTELDDIKKHYEDIVKDNLGG